jgi:DNA modification methylase
VCLDSLVNAINDQSIVSGLTHDFYRYPARFSPLFPRAAIQLFTKPGDTVLDPFMGSSTSLVESLALGRHAIGTDISSLAVFLARVKTCLLDDGGIDEIRKWVVKVVPKLSPRSPAVRYIEWQDAGYQDNLPWRFRKVVEQSLSRAEKLDERLQPVARCIVLKTVQWAVDCRKRLPTAAEFREKMIEHSTTVASGLKALREQVESLRVKPATIEVHQCSAEEISGLKSDLLRRRPPKLVVTSPPYPAVHVLYHRWQVLGRRETAAPFWIADCQDGQGASFYTFGDRRRQDHDEQYFDRLIRCFSDLRRVVRDDCVVVQLVGFARPSEQLPSYMEAMKTAGFLEFNFGKAGHRLCREELWRAVPNRKWYAALRAETTQTKEILLVHRAR